MAEIGLDLLRNSGEPRPRASRRADVVMTVLSVWFVLGLLVGRVPAVTELWTGVPIVAALVGWLLAVLVLPTAQPHPATVASERVMSESG